MKNLQHAFSRRGRAARGLALLLLAAPALVAHSPTAAAQQTVAAPAGAAQTSPAPAAQPAPAPATPQAPPAAEAPRSVVDSTYRIGPGDIVDVLVFNRPQLSRAGARVDNPGYIRMPLLEQEIKAACLTESELAASVARAYLEYQKNPRVDVFVKDFQSQPVAVIGAVNAPGRFQLQRPVRLLELLIHAGGPALNAAKTIQVLHASMGNSAKCEEAAPAAPAEGETAADALSMVSVYERESTMNGEDKSNPFIRPGDVVSIAVEDQTFAYILGNVHQPQKILLKEEVPLTRALAMCGGLRPGAKKKVRIVRQPPGAKKQEILVDLAAIDKKNAEDIALMANDIVEVPTEGGFKGAMRGLQNMVVPMVMRLPMTVIP